MPLLVSTFAKMNLGYAVLAIFIVYLKGINAAILRVTSIVNKQDNVPQHPNALPPLEPKHFNLNTISNPPTEPVEIDSSTHSAQLESNDPKLNAVTTQRPEPKEIDNSTGFHFVVSVQVREKSHYKHLCGGSIIGAQFVLTAAHCVLNPKKLKPSQLSVTGGSTQLHNKISMQRFQVKEIRWHEKFKPLRGYDLVILKVAPKFPLDNERFGIANFGNFSRKRSGLESLLLGWGRVQPGKPKNLETVHFSTIDDKKCLKTHRFKYLTNTEICAVNRKGSRGACDGDSGGPLIDAATKVLYGLLSYGRKACEKGKPFAFTRISVNLKWIENQMNKMLKG